ncbi:MAG: hypothetical protein II479_02850 [Bacteroidales bacterium]|nr:hypothetical protein [Bacteroidales bacterium]
MLPGALDKKFQKRGAEMPHIRKAYEAFHGDRFDVVGIAVWDKHDDTVAALEKLNLPWKSCCNKAGTAHNKKRSPDGLRFFGGAEGTIKAVFSESEIITCITGVCCFAALSG